MKKFQHGGDIYSRPIDYDFSANINPLGMPERVKEGLITSIAHFSVYPDTMCRKLNAAIAQHENLPEEMILCGNGAADLIFRIVYATRPQKALVLAPTFSEYEKALTTSGCEVIYHLLKEEEDFCVTERLLEQLDETLDIVFLCQPNNPVGNVISPNVMAQVVACCIDKGILLVVDECFLDFMAEADRYTAKQYLPAKGLIILKAFTKMYAMAGLRLGYMLCSDQSLLQAVKECGQAWSVSGPAQLAGTLALQETAYCEATRKLICKERRYLSEALRKLGLKVYPSETNFLLFQADPFLEKALEAEKIAVRSCSNYEGLDETFYRIAVRLHHENEVLIQAIERNNRNGKTNYDSRHNV